MSFGQAVPVTFGHNIHLEEAKARLDQSTKNVGQNSKTIGQTDHEELWTEH